MGGSHETSTDAGADGSLDVDMADVQIPEAVLGQRLRAARRSAGLTQSAVAALSGVHRTYVGSIERGEQTPTLWVLINLAQAVAVDPSVLVAGLRPLKFSQEG